MAMGCNYYLLGGARRGRGREPGCISLNVFLVFLSQAKLIEFDPVRATDVKLPDGATFVISNCCVELNKAATGHFNTRVAECRLATQVLNDSV